MYYRVNNTVIHAKMEAPFILRAKTTPPASAHTAQSVCGAGVGGGSLSGAD